MKGVSLLFALALFVAAGSSAQYKQRYNAHSGSYRMNGQHRGHHAQNPIFSESSEQFNEQNTHWRNDDNKYDDNWNNQRPKSSSEQSINSLEEFKHGSKWTNFPSWSSSSSEEEEERRMNNNDQNQEFGGKKKYANWFYEFFGVSNENSGESQSEEGRMAYNNKNNNKQQRRNNKNNQQYQYGNSNSNNNNNMQTQWDENEEKTNKIKHVQRVVKNPQNSNEICVTVNPVPTCPCQWSEQQAQQELVPVVCKQKQELKNFNAVTLQEALQRGEVEIKWQQAPKMLRVPMAKKCVKSNRHSASTYSLSTSEDQKF